MFGKIRKYLLYCIGLVFVGVGIAGYVLPGLPGTIFLILAAGCFLRSNERMYVWVTEHRLFGKLVKNYMETGGMPKRAKVISVTCVWVFSSISLFSPYNWIFKILVLALAVIGTWFILSRPTYTSTDD
ncbi:MAG TPA: DUF454 domain-containing protein [Dehalococcoidia bacterium]|nr:DUF454 domain-containing protein [Dehalococcoidia bacterium]|tara:strand:- start:628 stop:1011 length:384 start_codon:yes stop_codon:yes gene_type:complete